MIEPILIDRDEPLELFREMLSKARGTRVLRLSGSEKMGKSRLLREFRNIAKSEFNAMYAFVDLRSRLQDENEIISTICEQIGLENFPNYFDQHKLILNQTKVEVSRVGMFRSVLNIQISHEKARADNEQRALILAFIKDLQQLPKVRPIVLLFDAFEQADDYLKIWLNEQLLSKISNIHIIYVVFAGRQLPRPLEECLHICEFYELLPVSLSHHLYFCEKTGIVTSLEIITALHRVFEGNPGYFVEFAPKLMIEQSHER